MSPWIAWLLVALNGFIPFSLYSGCFGILPGLFQTSSYPVMRNAKHSAWCTIYQKSFPEKGTEIYWFNQVFLTLPMCCSLVKAFESFTVPLLIILVYSKLGILIKNETVVLVCLIWSVRSLARCWNFTNHWRWRQTNLIPSICCWFMDHCFIVSLCYEAGFLLSQILFFEDFCLKVIDQ